MVPNELSTSLYKAGANIMLDACKTYFTYMERLRDIQRRTDSEFADSAARCANQLKSADDLTQCSAWQQQAYAEQIGRWNQYILELIQFASEGQSIAQVSVRNGLDQVHRSYASLATYLPAMPNAPQNGVDTGSPSRKSDSQRTNAQ